MSVVTPSDSILLFNYFCSAFLLSWFSVNEWGLPVADVTWVWYDTSASWSFWHWSSLVLAYADTISDCLVSRGSSGES